MQSSSSAAIVLYKEPSTFFESFMDTLFDRRPMSIKTTSGSVVWSGVPYEEILAIGLYPVHLNMGQKLGLPKIETRELLFKATDPVNRYISAGLELQYGDAARAAMAFEQCVEEATRQFSRQSSTPRPMHEIWLDSVARFFASAIKVVLERLQVLQLAIDGFERLNLATIQGHRISYVEGKNVNQARELIQQYQIHVQTDWERSYYSDSLWSGQRIERFIQSLQDTADLKMLRMLPLRLKCLPKDIVIDGTISIAGNWFRTQILLAAMEIEDVEREHLEGELEVERAADLIRNYKPGRDSVRIIERFFDRMEKRGFELTFEAQRFHFQGIVRSQLSAMKRDDEKFGKPDKPYMPQVLFRVDIGEEEFDHEEAISSLLNREKTDRKLRRAPPKVQAKVRRRIRAAVDYSKLTELEAQSLVEDQQISIKELAKSIALLQSEVRPFVVKTYLDKAGTEPDPDILVTFLELGVFPHDVDLIGRVADILPEAETESLLRTLLSSLLEDPDHIDEHVAGIFSALVRRVLQTRQRELMEDISLRRVLCSIVLELQEDYLERSSSNICSRPNDLITVWGSFCANVYLSEIVVAREDMYANPDRYLKMDGDPRAIELAIMTWRQYALEPEGRSIGEQLMLLGAERQQRILHAFSEFPEESAFRWRFADDPTLEARWNAYARNQVAFRKRFTASGQRSASAQKKKKK